MQQKSSILHKVSVVGSIASATSLSHALEMPLADSCDIVELRLDAWPQHADVSRIVAQKWHESGFPVLITARAPSEGGKNELSVTERHNLLLKHLDSSSLVDVEISSLGEMKETLAACHSRAVPVIGSFHDFSGMGSDAELQDKLLQAKESGLAAAKFALTLAEPGDLARAIQLLQFGLKIHQFPTSVMGMGPLGKISRLTLAKCGSVLNYGFLDEATVPGQWEARDLKARLAEL